MTAQPMSTPDPSSMSPAELSAEVLRARADLAATIDELSTRLSPKTLASEAATTARLAATDAGAFVTGAGLPKASRPRARNAKIVLGVAAGVVALVALTVVRRARR
jgi:hypothetical protein